MSNIRKDLIQKELQADINNGFEFKNIKNIFSMDSFLSMLSKEYYVYEACEFFYDSEPELDDYISDVSFMYNYCSEKELNSEECYSKKYILEKYGKEYNEEEARLASLERERIYKEYNNSERKITFNNWIEVYGDGIWGMSQDKVNDVIMKNIKEFKSKYKEELKDRVYYSQKDDIIRVYLYGRDCSVDWWIIYKKKHRSNYKRKDSKCLTYKISEINYFKENK